MVIRIDESTGLCPLITTTKTMSLRWKVIMIKVSICSSGSWLNDNGSYCLFCADIETKVMDMYLG